MKKFESKGNWSNIEKVCKITILLLINDLKKNLKLINEDVKQDDPNDLAYAYSGFAPIM